MVPGARAPNALAVTSVECSSPADCTAVVSDGTSDWSTHTSDFGQSWRQEGALPSLFIPGDDLTCTQGDSCLIAGYVPISNGHGEGAVAVSADGGQTWTRATVPAGLGVLQDVACLDPTTCLAAGSTSTTVSDVVPAKGELLRSSDGGNTWVPAATAVPVDDVYGVACPSARQCALVGSKWTGDPAVATGAAAQSVDGGLTFVASASAYVPISLTAISCPSPSRCVAVGGDTVARLELVGPRAVPAKGRRAPSGRP